MPAVGAADEVMLLGMRGQLHCLEDDHTFAKSTPVKRMETVIAQ